MGDSSGTRSVVITGGAVGLGRAMAQRFHALGHQVLVCSRTQSELDALAAELPGTKVLRADVAVDADRRALVAAAGEMGADVWINNAAIVRAHDYLSSFTLDTDRARDELEINFAAPIELIRLFLQQRRSAGAEGTPATIVNVNTPGALFPLEANLLYCATKAGLHMFTEALRRQLASTPVRVVEIFPPSLDTRLARDLEVVGQSDNGDQVIREVGDACVEGILTGTKVVLPHPAAAMMYEMFANTFEGEFIDQINMSVQRRPGWDTEG